MKTQYYTSSSLDGFLATEDDSLEWLFTLGDISETSYPSFIEGVGAIAMGSSTFEWILRNADTLSEQTGTAWPYTQPTWVFTSRKLPTMEGVNVTFANGDVRAAHSEMLAAANGKNVWIMGGGGLAAQFHDAGLLDEIIVQVGSATLGSGKPLFPRRLLSPGLVLISATQVGTAFAELTYNVLKEATNLIDER